MKKTKDAVAITGEYTNNQGEQKKRYTNVGALFERPDGSQCLKLESVPVSFDGWINFYEPKISQAKQVVQEPNNGFEDDIPF